MMKNAWRVMGLFGLLTFFYCHLSLIENNVRKQATANINPNRELDINLGNRNSVNLSKDWSADLTHNISFKIPYIIHQTWDNEYIPKETAPWVRSWLSVHRAPSWQHWLWSAAGARRLIGRAFPHHLALYDQYPYLINRADVRRYFLLYQYGGVYADLDVESLHRLDDGRLARLPCVIAQEPPAHQALLYHHQAALYAMPAFMACRPRHPFFKLLIDKLAQYISLAWTLPWNDNIFRSTGPMFVSDVLELYAKHHNDTPENYVYLAPSDWFMPTFDAANIEAFREHCANVSCSKKPCTNDTQTASVCSHLEKTHYRNVPGPDAFTDHHWLHAWGNHFQTLGTVPISQVVPSVRVIHNELPDVT